MIARESQLIAAESPASVHLLTYPMPFEPLRTDEPIEAPAPKERDFDTQMLAGCTTFVAVSLLVYGLSVWPYFVFQNTHELKALALASSLGLIPAALAGGYSVWKWGLAAAGGFVSGALATAIFLMLRLKQVLLTEGIEDLPQAEFPPSWQYLVPGAWMLVVLALIALLLRKEELGHGEN